MSRYNVGDLLRVREWDDMFLEYDVVQRPDGSTDIYVGGETRSDDCVFTSEMRRYCGQEFIVSKVYKTYLGAIRYQRCGTPISFWSISANMLEPVRKPNKKYITATNSELNKLFEV